MCFDAFQRERQELREVGEPPLRVRSEVARTGCEDEQRSPGVAGGMDRSDDGRQEPRLARHPRALARDGSVSGPLLIPGETA